MLEIRHLFKSYKTGKTVNPVLKDVNITVEKGEFVAVMGASGSGKTTLLNCISRFIPFDRGNIILDHKDLGNLNDNEMAALRNTDLGFVFQDFMLLDGLTVLENVCVPKVIQKENYKPMEEKAKALLHMFSIADITNKYPVEISGGQKQRVAVARALMDDPGVILADEPTGNLDSRSSEAVIQSFLTAQKNLGATIFMVTHDSYSASFCDRVIVMKDGTVYKELCNNGNQRAFLNRLLNTLGSMNGGETNDNKQVMA